VYIVEEVFWALGSGCTGTVNLAPPPQEFDSRTVHVVAIRYMSYAVPAHSRVYIHRVYLLHMLSLYGSLIM
jgi:hypothetical protein